MPSRPLRCTNLRVFAPATLIVVTLGLGGCGAGDSSGTGGASNGNAPPTTRANGDANKNAPAQTDPAKDKTAKNFEPAAPRPLLAGWEKPAAAIVVSGEQQGYFEPCGCTAMQTGGMSRRGDLFKQLAEKGWPVTAVDVGGSTLRDGRQSLLKFQTMLDAMREMKYRALAVGPEELRLGLDNLLQMLSFDPNNPDDTLSLMSANVVFFDSPELGTPRPWRIIKVGDVKIGVTAILGQDFNGTALLSKNNKGLKINDPAEVLPATISELKKQSPDVMLLLSHTSLEESRSLAKKFPEFDVVVSAGGPEDPDGTTEKIGKSMLFSSGRKGKSVSVVGFYPDAAKDKFRFELVELRRDRFRDSPQIVELMRAYQGRLKEEKLAGNHQDNIGAPHPSGATFVGAEKCGSCHQKAFDKWKETKHFHAFESLEHPRAGEPDYGITRVFDAECLTCHVAGWEPQRVFRYKSGFINAEFADDDAQKSLSAILKGVQCENCHGPGSKHIELVDNGQLDEAKPLMRVTLETARKDLCFNCHDSENSPHFDFDKYWPDIAHPGLD